MIKINELRVGNFVQIYDNSVPRGEQVVVEITIENIVEILSNPSKYEGVSFNEYWLNYLGFMIDNGRTYYNGNWYLFYKNLQGMCLYNKHFKNVCFINGMMYVHTLQNIFYDLSENHAQYDYPKRL